MSRKQSFRAFALLATTLTVAMPVAGAAAQGSIYFSDFTGGDQTRSQIFKVSPSGKHVRRITNGPGHNDSASLFPNGRQLAFASDRDGDFAIYKAHTDGSHEHLLLKRAGEQTSPSVSPNGKRLAYASNSGHSSRYSLHVAAIDGSHDRELVTDLRLRWRDRIAWAPDGHRLAVIAETHAAPHRFGLYTVSPEGKHLKTLVKGRGVIEAPFASAPSYSSSGSQVAFTGYGAGGQSFHEQVFKVRSAGGDPHPLTGVRKGLGGTSNGEPSYSPSGNTIAFTHNGRLAMMKPDGSRQKPVKVSGHSVSAPIWVR